MYEILEKKILQMMPLLMKRNCADILVARPKHCLSDYRYRHHAGIGTGVDQRAGGYRDGGQ